MDATKEILMGTLLPQGAILQDNGVAFSIFSQYSKNISLVLFDQVDGPATNTFPMTKDDNHIWNVFVEGIKAGQLYGFKVEGEYDPAHGQRYNQAKLVMDPYAKAITGKFKNEDNLIFSYDLNSPEKDLAIDPRDNWNIVPKSIVIDDHFDWENDKPLNIPKDQLVIYEAHIKGFTAHPSFHGKDGGTYLAFIEKIPYLKSLGINAVELMPVHEFYRRTELTDKGLSDYWGYNTIGFFAPESSYSSQSYLGCQVHEFKTLVKKLHQAGIEVILDVVYNHTGEGNHLGPTFSFKGVENPTYYKLMANPENANDEPYRYYINDSGCGNTLNVEHPQVMQMVLDSLRYWAEVMHVDGFRFDLASILARAQGEFSHDSVFFEAISRDPILRKVKMIAEPWDLTTYQVGNFPKGWSEWNGRFRDSMRKFIKGDEGQIGEIATRVAGSSDLYQNDGRKPYNSINFITCHDGFTLMDLVSYNEKHNEGNLENNQDGANDNHSWNCGVEGPTEDPEVLNLRHRLAKNAFFSLLFSAGTPMILQGDEILHSRQGNNNAYCQDNELNWFNWDEVAKNNEMLKFVRKAISMRKYFLILQKERFYTAQQVGPDQMPDVKWFDDNLQTPNWDDPQSRILCYQIVGRNSHAKESYSLFFILNSDHQAHDVTIPQYSGIAWSRLVDTSAEAGQEIHLPGEDDLLQVPDKFNVQPRTFVLLLGR